VATRRDAQNVYYSLPPGPAQEIIAVLYGIYCGPSRPGRRRAAR
jgi:hypothetical protein